MKKVRQIRVLGFLAVFMLAFAGSAGAAQAVNMPTQTSPDLTAGKVTICHHPPGQPEDVYNYQSVSTSSVFGGNGHDSHPGDVVPPFEGYSGSAKWREDPVQAAQFLANGCSNTPPTTSPAPTPCPTTDTPVPTPTTATPTPTPTTATPTPSPSPTTGAPTPDPTTGAPTTGAPTTGAPTTGAPTTGPTGTSSQGGGGAAGGGSAANCTCPDAAAAIAAAEAAGLPVPTAGPDGVLVDPVSGNTVRPCALAYTGIEEGGFPVAPAVLGLGTLAAGVVAIALTLIPRGRHG